MINITKIESKEQVGIQKASASKIELQGCKWCQAMQEHIQTGSFGHWPKLLLNPWAVGHLLEVLSSLDSEISAIGHVDNLPPEGQHHSVAGNPLPPAELQHHLEMPSHLKQAVEPQPARKLCSRCSRLRLQVTISISISESALVVEKWPSTLKTNWVKSINVSFIWFHHQY